jgi:FkbM family methyltransferase
MTRLLAKLFRNLNAHIVTTPHEWVRKPLKVLFLIAVYFRSWSLRRFNGKPSWEIIDNYDKTIKLKIDRSRTMGASFFWTGFHELREFIFLHRFLKKEMIVIDIGANLGEYTLFIAKRLTAGKVISFEPMQSIREQLIENISLNCFMNVNVIPFGLSAREQVLQFHEVDDVHEGLNTFYLGERKSKNVSEIQLKTLDSQIEILKIAKIDFIKIDVEGSELPALIGARKSIARWRPYIMVEVNDLTYKAAGYSIRNVETFFRELNYKPNEINKKGKLQETVSLPSFGNIVFVPD